MKNVEQTQAALKVEHKNISNRVSMPMTVAVLTRTPAIVPAFAVLSPPPLLSPYFQPKVPSTSKQEQRGGSHRVPLVL